MQICFEKEPESMRKRVKCIKCGMNCVEIEVVVKVEKLIG